MLPAVPDDSRGYYTGWLQTSLTFGIVVSLAVMTRRGRISAETRRMAGVPFLISSRWWPCHLHPAQLQERRVPGDQGAGD
jgi:hypothetical protein